MAKVERKFKSKKIAAHVEDLTARFKRKQYWSGERALCKQGQRVRRWFLKHGHKFKTFKAAFDSDPKFWTPEAIEANLEDRGIDTYDAAPTVIIPEEVANGGGLFNDNIEWYDLNEAEQAFVRKHGWVKDPPASKYE